MQQASSAFAVAMLSLAMAGPAGASIAEDYARAERFLVWNQSRYLVNADIQHHWIGKEDRFWYLRTNASGSKEFVVVDARSGRRRRAFDHERIARSLASAAGVEVDAGDLPFSSFRYVQEGKAIELRAFDKLWTCRTAVSKCVANQTPDPSREAVSPDGRWAAFVRNNNLWIRPLPAGAEIALSSDAVEHYTYATSWSSCGRAKTASNPLAVTRPHAIWSPDSRHLMAYRLDERDVRPAYLIQSVPDDGSVRPQLRTCRYPMPGDEHLPLYEPILFDVVTRRQWRLPHVSTWRSVLSYYLSWSADGRDVYSLNLDRFSRTLTLTRANALTGDVRELLTEKSVTRVHANAGSAIDLPVVRVLGSGDILWYSQRDGWGHLYYYDAPGTLRAQITRGNWNVRSIAYVDEARHLVYFTASGREDGRDPYEEHLYRSRFDGTGMQLLTPEDADHDFHHTSPSVSDDASLKDPERASFSPSGRYFVDTYSRPDLPSVLTLRRADGGLVKQLEQADISKLQKDGYTPVEPFRTVAADGITAIYGNLFRPSTFDATKKYPVIDAVYPGPQIVRVRKDFTAAHFDIFEAQSLAELGFIVVTVDGRGTPNRSKAFADHSYGRLDRASDPEDHIAAIRELAHRYPYMDVSRVGIDGASGGGYAAARGVLAYPDFYKVAVAAEGNHDWRGYLAGWAETFIGPLGERDYSVTSNLPLAANLKGKLLLAHGEMDDNVLPMQALKLADALVKANRDFDLLIVPNERHDMFITSPYFIRRKWDYFVRNLLGAEPPAGYRIERSQ